MYMYILSLTSAHALHCRVVCLQADEFCVRAVDLGILQTIRVRHDNTKKEPGWYLDGIVVKSPQGQKTVFKCNKSVCFDAFHYVTSLC